MVNLEACYELLEMCPLDILGQKIYFDFDENNKWDFNYSKEFKLFFLLFAKFFFRIFPLSIFFV